MDAGRAWDFTDQFLFAEARDVQQHSSGPGDTPTVTTFLFAEAQDVQQHLSNAAVAAFPSLSFYSLKRETFSSTRDPTCKASRFLFAEAQDVQQHGSAYTVVTDLAGEFLFAGSADVPAAPYPRGGGR